MNSSEALILGLLQGLTEFLPISSSGHLELGKVLLNLEQKEDIVFTVVVHGATVLSTLLVFFTEIKKLITDSLQMQWNESTQYIGKLALSLLPVAIVGLLWEEQIEILFTGNLLLVGSALLLTSLLLFLATRIKNRGRAISFSDAFIIGMAQAAAVLPGLSRSGATISTGLLLGNDKAKVTEFSFLMVLVPVLGANVKILLSGDINLSGDIRLTPLIVGFVAAFMAGYVACQWMISIVKKGKLIYFSMYCLLIGLLAIIFS